MSNYIINHSVDGFETTDINDNRLRDSDSTVILVLDESTSNDLVKYYNAVIDIILSGAKLYCIAIGKESNIRKPIMMAMTNYRNYNIYRINDISIADSDYINTILNREPDIEEVMQFVGGDISAYSELSVLIFGISNLVDAGDMNGLKTFIEQHVDSIGSSIEVIEYLKSIADKANSGSMQSMINNLKTKVEQYTRDINSLNSDIDQYRSDNEKLNDRITSLNKDLQKANRKAEDLAEQLEGSSSGQSIVTYSPLNVTLIKCKTQHIIYFKEISYVKYTNSLVLHLFKILKSVYNNKIKLMIYDNKVGIPGLYKGISILSSQEYLSNKDKIISDTGTFVVAEPNPVFLESILTNISPVFEVIIVYDRMRQAKDLVMGPNVTKIFVCNSESNLNNAREVLKMPSDSMIISSDPNIKNAFNISTIPDFNKATDSAKIAKYSKMLTREGSKDRLIFKICESAKIKLLQ